MNNQATHPFSMNSMLRNALALLLALSLAGCSSAPEKPDNPQRLPACGWLPNCVNSQSGRGAQASEPIAANESQWQQLKKWISEQEDWEISVDDGNFLQAVAITPLLQFRDDVQLLFIPDEQLIHVRSSSRAGISDLGTNARRIETLKAQVKP